MCYFFLYIQTRPVADLEKNYNQDQRCLDAKVSKFRHFCGHFSLKNARRIVAKILKSPLHKKKTPHFTKTDNIFLENYGHLSIQKDLIADILYLFSSFMINKPTHV